jgi:prepilin-type N-terminal cleavage/methylation domain-containing protein
MKLPSAPSPFPRKAGFTLVELLVVMGIIAILAAVTLSVAGTVINSAKRAKAQNTATQIQTAVLNYYTEYSVYPAPASTTTDYEINDADTATGAGTAKWGPLIECLSGMIKPCNGTTSTETVFTNTRSIAFLTLKGSDVTGASATDPDAPINPITPNTTTNPYFNIAIDTDYDGILGGNDATSGAWLPNFTTVTTGSAPPYTGNCTSGVAVWANCNPNSNIQNSNNWVKTY